MTTTDAPDMAKKSKLPTPTAESTAFGRRIQRARQAAGLSCYALARQLVGEEAELSTLYGMATYLGRIEKGVVLNPSFFMVAKIAALLGLDLNELAG